MTEAKAESKNLAALKQTMQVFATKAVEARLEAEALAVVAEYGGQPVDFSQAANALAVIRAIRKIDPQYGPKSLKGRYEKPQWEEIVGTHYKGGNSSALRQAISDAGKGVTAIAAAYAADNL